MNTLTFKLPDDLDTALQLASQRHKVSKSELVRHNTALTRAAHDDVAATLTCLLEAQPLERTDRLCP